MRPENVPNERNRTKLQKNNKMETSNPLDAEFETLVLRVLNELTEICNSIKKGHGNGEKEPVTHEGSSN